MGEILSAEDIANTRAAAMNVYHEAPDPFMRGMLRILDSHEALRARLAEVEAEREAARSNVAHWSAEWSTRLRAAEARLAEVEQVVRKVAQHPCYDVREWVGEVVPCGSCPSCITRAVLDKGKPDER